MKKTAYVIGIDIGTQGTKAGLFDASGVCYAEAYEASVLLHPAPGAVEQDPDALYASVLHTVREVLEKSGAAPGAVLALSVAGQMAGIQGIDREWNAVTPYDNWLDTRCEPYIREMKAEAEEEIIRSTGGPVTYAHGPKILWWKRQHPDVYQKIYRFVPLSAYVAGRLCGLKGDQAWFDYTHLHFTGFSDTKSYTWNPALLRTFGVDGARLGCIRSPYDVVGGLTKAAAEVCGLRAGTPITAGCGDSAASSLGAGITEPGILYDVAGTASIFSACTDFFAPDTENRTVLYAHSVIRDLWIPLAYISGGGLCLRWFRDTFLGASSGGSGYGLLEQEAAGVEPGSAGLYFIPHFAGRTCPNDPSVRGTWLGLEWHHTRAHMYRSVMEAIAYEYRLYNKIISDKTGQNASVVYGVGGGSESTVFNQIKADVLGADYVPMKCGDTGIAGSALIAGMAAGLYSDEQDMRRAAASNVKKGEAVRFNKDAHTAYSSCAETYVQMLQGVQALYKIRPEETE